MTISLVDISFPLFRGRFEEGGAFQIDRFFWPECSIPANEEWRFCMSKNISWREEVEEVVTPSGSDGSCFSAKNLACFLRHTSQINCVWHVFCQVLCLTLTTLLHLPVTVDALTPAAVNPLLAFLGRFLRSRRLKEGREHFAARYHQHNFYEYFFMKNLLDIFRIKPASVNFT